MDRVRSERSTIPAITANKYLFSRFLQSPTTCFLSAFCYAFFAFTMSTNSGFRDAPPTKNPSISGCVAIRTPVNPQKIVRVECKRTQLFAVSSINAASIYDTSAFSYSWGHNRSEILSCVSVHFLGLSGCGDFARANCPDRLVSDDDEAM